MAYISAAIMEGARDGRTVAELTSAGAALLTRAQVREGIPEMIPEIQVGSHYRFAEANPALAFDRTAARGYRLDIAAGTAVRFEPGQQDEAAARQARGRSRRARQPARDALAAKCSADGELLVCEPASMLPMAQRHFLVLTSTPWRAAAPTGSRDSIGRGFRAAGRRVGPPAALVVIW